MKPVLGSTLVGVAIGFPLVPAFLHLYLLSGTAPVATFEPALPLEHFLAKTALRAKLRKELSRDVPIAADVSNLAFGAIVYRDNCAVCHGLRNRPPSPLGGSDVPSASAAPDRARNGHRRSSGRDILEGKKWHPLVRDAGVWEVAD